MNKTTKNILIIGILGAGALLLLKNSRKSSFTGVPGNRVKSMVGFTGVPGKRVKSFTNEPGSRKRNITDRVNVQSSRWVRNANGAPASFYQVKSTNW